MTREQTDATPCTRLSGVKEECGSTHLRYNENHAWCSVCGAKRDIPKKNQFYRMTYQFTYTTANDPSEAHKHICEALTDMGVSSMEQQKVESL